MKLYSIIQARTNSKRLKNKVLKKIKRKMLIQYVYESVKNSKLFDEIIVATSKNFSDKKIVNWCKKKKLNFIQAI